MGYPYGYCGMPCALCSRYRTEGTSRCLGCSDGGYYTEACKAHACARTRSCVHCGACADYPCARLGRMRDFRDLCTGHAKQRTCAAIASGGFDAWETDYAARAALLTSALARYNDGRMKRYLCELFIQNDLACLTEIMRRASSLSGDRRALGRAFRLLADELRAPLQPEDSSIKETNGSA